MRNFRPPRILCAFAILWLVIVVVTFSDAGVPFPTWFVVSFLTVAVLACSLIRSIATFTRKNQAWWTLTFAVIASGLALANTSQLLTMRLYLSAGSLQESAALLAAIKPEHLYEEGEWVGLFRVRQFAQYGSELRFITNDCGVVDSCGFVFSPNGPPPNRGEDLLSHLYGPWWHWHQSF